MTRTVRKFAAQFTIVLAAMLATGTAASSQSLLKSIFGQEAEWPKTNFQKASVDLDEIVSGGPPKDGIPSIDEPKFIAVSEEKSLGGKEPVIGLEIDGDARAYPLRILTWHEIVNDTVGGVPVIVTYCPLCNSAIVFKRTINGKVHDFGTTGKLRKSDMVMYDRQTETWWQQFLGKGIVGDLTDVELESVPARLEAFDKFKARHPGGKVLIPNNPRARPYGQNFYASYDKPGGRPYSLFRGDLPTYIEPMARVVAFELDGKPHAVSLELLRKNKTMTLSDITLSWEAGQNSALDTEEIKAGRDVGNVLVRRKVGSKMEDVVYDVTFAFVFNAFHPDRKIQQE